MRNDKADVVEYLCSLTSSNSELLIDGHPLPSYRPLQHVRSANVAKKTCRMPSKKKNKRVLVTL